MREVVSRFILVTSIPLVFLGSYAVAQAEVACTKISGAIVENLDLTLPVRIAAGVITGDLRGGIALIGEPAEAAPDGGSVIKREGFITLESGDVLRIRSELALAERGGKPFVLATEQATILGGTGRFRRASGSFESYGSQDTITFDMARRYRGEVCTPAG